MKARILLLSLLTLVFTLVVVACATTTLTTAPTTGSTTTTTPAVTTPTTTTLPATLDLLPDLQGDVQGLFGVYDLSIAENVATVAYDKRGLAWPGMVVEIDESMARFNKLVLTVSGEGTLLVRLQNATEVWDTTLTLTAGDVTHQIDLLDKDTFLTTLETIQLIAAPGNGAGRGEFVIKKLEFDIGSAFGTTADVETPGYTMNSGWVSLDAGVNTFTPQLDDSVKVDYVKAAGQGYSFINNVFVPEEVAGYNTMTVVLKGTVGKTLLVKPNDMGYFEETITFANTNPVTKVYKDSSWTKLLFCAEPSVESVSGSFYIMSVTFSYEEPNVSVFEQVDMKAGWTPSAAGLYTIVETAAKTTISYDRTSGDAWTNLKHTVDTDLFLGNHNAVKIVVKGTVGAEILVKPNDYWKTEMKIVFDGTEQTVIIPVANATKFVTLLVDPFLGSLTGSFEIMELKSLFIPTGSNNVNSGWVSIDAGVYTFTPQNTGTVIVGYAKAVGQTWPAMKADFAPASALGMNTMRIVLKGTPGKSVLVKPNDSGALEQMITFADTNPVTVYVTADAFTKLLIFAEPNTEAVNGMFEILSVSLYYVKPDALPRETIVDFETGWEDGGDSVYTFAAAGGITTVTYNKTALPWAMMQYEFSDNLSNHNTVTFVVSGTAGKQILIKLNNNNALQTNYTFLVTGAQETVKIPLTALLASVQIFAEPGDLTQTASGTFDIVSAQVTFEKEVDITSGWALNDAGTYVIGEADVDGSIDVSYTKLTFDWAYIINNFDAEAVEGCNTLTLVLIGEATKTMMLKPNDVDTPTITFTGVEQTFTFTREAFTKMVMIAAPGTQGVSGTFTIVSMVLSYVAPAE